MDTIRKEWNREASKVVGLLNSELSVTAEPVHLIPTLTIVLGHYVLGWMYWTHNLPMAPVHVGLYRHPSLPLQMNYTGGLTG